jgi:hypothetical protein
MIKIDLITIAYENKNELLDTLNSIIDINEYIGKLIIKDGSKKKLLDENDEIIKKFSNLIYLHSKDLGPYDAMNQAMTYLENDFTWFLNSGDVLTCKENFLESIDGLDEFYYIAIYNWLLDGNVVKKEMNKNIFLNRIKYTWGARHQSMFFNSNVIRKYNLQYDLDLKITADRKFMLEFANLANYDHNKFFSKNIFLTNNDQNGLCQNEIFKKEKENLIITNQFGTFFDKCKTLMIFMIKSFLFKVKQIEK